MLRPAALGLFWNTNRNIFSYAVAGGVARG
jgi:hypothetical protein